MLNAVVVDFYSRLDDAVIVVPYRGATWSAREAALLVAVILGGGMAGVTEALAATPRRNMDELIQDVSAFVARAAGVAPPA